MLPSWPFGIKIYRGSKEDLRRRSAENFKTAHRIADHIKRLIANNPNEVQRYHFADIARSLGVTIDQVRDTLSDGRHNEITLRIDAADRRELERHKVRMK